MFQTRDVMYGILFIGIGSLFLIAVAKNPDWLLRTRWSRRVLEKGSDERMSTRAAYTFLGVIFIGLGLIGGLSGSSFLRYNPSTPIPISTTMPLIVPGGASANVANLQSVLHTSMTSWLQDDSNLPHQVNPTASHLTFNFPVMEIVYGTCPPSNHAVFVITGQVSNSAGSDIYTAYAFNNLDTNCALIGITVMQEKPIDGGWAYVQVAYDSSLLSSLNAANATMTP